MGDDNAIQYATIFDAFGSVLRYNSSDASISVVDAPKGQTTLMDKALKEIKHFDDTKNYVDGMSALCVADFIDDHPNPIKEEARLNIMEALGIMQDGLYISQVLMLQKNNRSWHYSEVPNDCTYFGEECTHRGINPDPERKGRTSSRKPQEYHQLNGRKEITREQLVTNSLNKIYKSIPSENLVSAKPSVKNIILSNLKAFKQLGIDDKLRIIEELQEGVNT